MQTRTLKFTCIHFESATTILSGFSDGSWAPSGLGPAMALVPSADAIKLAVAAPPRVAAAVPHRLVLLRVEDPSGAADNGSAWRVAAAFDGAAGSTPLLPGVPFAIPNLASPAALREFTLHGVCEGSSAMMACAAPGGFLSDVRSVFAATEYRCSPAARLEQRVPCACEKFAAGVTIVYCCCCCFIVAAAVVCVHGALDWRVTHDDHACVACR